MKRQFRACEDEDGGRVRVVARIGLAFDPISIVDVNHIERTKP